MPYSKGMRSNPQFGPAGKGIAEHLFVPLYYSMLTRRPGKARKGAESMTADQLREMLRASPFRPFDIHLADGRSLAIDHPELVAIAPPGLTIGVAKSEGTIEIVDLLLVTSLEPHANGRPRRSKRRRGE